MYMYLCQEWGSVGEKVNDCFSRENGAEHEKCSVIWRHSAAAVVFYHSEA